MDSMNISLVDILCNNPSKNLMFGRIIHSDNWLVFTPLKSDKLLFYNISNCSSYGVTVPREYYNDDKYHFFTGILYDDSIFLFGYSKCLVIEYNLNTREFHKIDICIDAPLDENEGFFHVNYFRNGNVVFFPFSNTSAVLEFDLVSKKYKVHVLLNEKYGFISIDKVMGNFILAPRNAEQGRILEWNMQQNIIKDISYYPVEFGLCKYSFFRTKVWNDKVILFKHCSDSNVILDPIAGSIELFDDFYKQLNLDESSYATAIDLDDKLVFISRKGMLIWDYLTNEKIFREFVPQKEVILMLDAIHKQRQMFSAYSKKVNDNEYLIENDFSKFKDFISFMSFDQ